MNFFHYTLLAILSCASTLTVAQAPDLESMDIITKSIPDGPVARVGTSKIEKIDFVLLYRTELQRFAENNPDATLSDENRVRIALYCMNILVEHELLYQDAILNHLKVSQEEVEKQADAQYERLKKSFSKSAKREVTEAEILERLGYTHRSDINQEMERALLRATMRKQIIEEHQKDISEATINEVYEKNKDQFVEPDQVHLRQIFIRGNSKNLRQRTIAKKKADTALRHIVSGKRFETVAKELSQAPGAEQGGDMGFKPTESILPVMREALKTMQKDDISEVLESEFGYHIIQLVEQKSAAPVSKENALSIIRANIGKQQGDMAVRQYCDRMIESGIRVDVFLELEKNLAHITGDFPGSSR